MDISIRPAKASDIKDYTDLLQRTYEASYVNEKLGLTKDCFSKEVFATKNSQDYLKGNLVVNDKQKTWLAFLGSKLIGSVTIEDQGKECELRGFYVAVEHQGTGIGRKLWKKALAFAAGKNVGLNLYAHNQKSIEMYKKWEFQIDREKGEFYRHWPEWPEGLRAKCLYMRLENSK